MRFLAIDFPPISHAVEWKTLFGGDTFGVNKVVLLMWLSVLAVLAFYLIASRKQQLDQRPKWKAELFGGIPDGSNSVVA
ncbi:MAG: hypothetical protein ACXW25_07130 [Rhodospirillales bacterium]